MNTTAIALLLGSFAFLTIIKIPITFALGISSVITAYYLNIPAAMIAQSLVRGINSFSLLSIPFFILAGEIISQGGISIQLIKFADVLVGRVRGGLAMVNVLDSTFFGGISGSTVADISSLGSIMIPMMEQKGYDKDYSVAITVATAAQAVLIPPSHNMIIYSLAAGGVSVGRLFLGGIIPGLTLAAALLIYTYVVAVKRDYPAEEPVPFKEAIIIIKDALLGVFTAVIILGGVISGIFTATESAAIAVVYAFIITFFVYKVPIKVFGKILTDSLNTLAVVLALIACSNAFGWMLAYLRVPVYATEVLLSISSNKYVILLIINLLLLLLGMIMDMAPLIMITTPILLPVVTAVGIDPVHFGIIMVLNLAIGLMTPPVGSALFVACAIGKISVEELTKALIPFYIVMIAVLLLITYIPSLTMFLPDLLMGS
ncbi:MAG: TRAP transporter large permease [Tepidanaerobacteraceae bacterium]|jgi:tripartite ATP-independent transporter DctM subunit